jgi:hypothetical protein
MQEQDPNPIMEEIEKEIADTKRKASDESPLEIEITEEKTEQPSAETAKQEEKEEQKRKYSANVQRKIDRLTKQRLEAEEQTRDLQESNAQLLKRLERLEQQNLQRDQQYAQNDFQKRYDLTKQALEKAIEEGDTKAQLEFTDQLADMRATIRVGQLQNNLKQQAPQQTKLKPQKRQVAQDNTPALAKKWWSENSWFNQKGYERESAAARAIDVQLDIEGYDKENQDYYDNLNSRLQKVFPELVSTNEVTESKKKGKSSNIVTPSAGGSSYKGNRVRMTQDQLRMARELGINDEASLKKYAAEIQRSQGR